MPIPFIDIFAGPGGLGEGFSSLKYKGSHVFKPVLSIEKEKRAHETLLLRSFYRQFLHAGRKIPQAYFKYLHGKLTKDDLFDSNPKESAKAIKEAQCIELGGKGRQNSFEHVDDLIQEALNGKDFWVLLGGPPCQAYSLAGRSRMGGIKENDPRVNLYKHYLRILAFHRPAVFVFENVRGLASSKLKDREIFEDILQSLKTPSHYLSEDSILKLPSDKKSFSYKLFGFAPSDTQEKLNSDNFNNYLIKTENFGIPQTRHRLIILGIRDDLCEMSPSTLQVSNKKISVEKAISGLPPLRSGLSKGLDTAQLWSQAIKSISSKLKYTKQGHTDGLLTILNNFDGDKLVRGDEFVNGDITVGFEKKWFLNKKLNGACNHVTRGHIKEDLHRYLFSAVFAENFGHSPKLSDFPEELLPNHKNAKGADFIDRFRVQVATRPATTITSHISKDGHYFIHPDPTQCRSLTVREAARIQTFPDDYFFCGPRTSQYVQVGNAVPPLLARKMAEIVYDWVVENNY